MKKFILAGGLVVRQGDISREDVVVEDGKIAKCLKRVWEDEDLSAVTKENPGFEIMDVRGKYLLPGLTDVHVHFRTPGMTQKEDWVTGSKAALAGGVTTVIDMPNTNPPTIDRESLELKRLIVKKDALVNYRFFLGATKTNLQEIKSISGVAGVKVYMGSSTGNLLVDDVETLEAFMKESGKILAIHAENEVCIQEGLREHQGELDPAVHSRIRAPECAEQAVRTVLELVKKYRSPVHFCHVSTRAEIELIRQFRKEQPWDVAKLVTVEVTPHHLFLSNADYEKYGNLVKVNPPLRSPDDVAALWEGIRDYTVDMIATDHAPHLLEEKKLPYAEAPSGVPGVQTMLPLLLDAALRGMFGEGSEGAFMEIVRLCCSNPRKRFGVGIGNILERLDLPADIVVVDPKLREKVRHKYLWTKSGWSPFDGRELTGWPIMTFVGGELMYQWPDKFGKTPGHEV